mmetsp:Transcript_35265/g.77228  ORF Transcript_35265/g.77228 Transcript_35265/m.77228 type:complete len:441 (-) Transcript_35265:30-1352(-)
MSSSSDTNASPTATANHDDGNSSTADDTGDNGHGFDNNNNNSSSNNSNNNNSNNNNNEATSDVAPIMTPHSLKSSEPDLNVIVGRDDNRRTYQHYSTILATYSEYIDTMLATPMRERESRTITFPDIDPIMWETIVNMHTLCGYRSSPISAPVTHVDTLVELVPLLDKYQFHDALGATDEELCVLFALYNGSAHAFTVTPAFVAREMVRIASVCYRFNLPRSVPEATRWAGTKLREMPTVFNEDDVRALLSITHNDQDVMTFVARTALGRRAVEGKSIDDIKSMIERKDFVDKYRLRSLQIDEQEDLLERLDINHCSIETAPQGSNILGRYVRHGNRGNAAQGAMKQFYHRCYDTDYGERGRIIVEAMDPFGEEWRISRVVSDEEEVAFSNDASRRTETNTLYKWCGGFGSLLPPKYGWVATELGDEPVPTLDYYISTKR